MHFLPISALQKWFHCFEGTPRNLYLQLASIWAQGSLCTHTPIYFSNICTFFLQGNIDDFEIESQHSEYPKCFHIHDLTNPYHILLSRLVLLSPWCRQGGLLMLREEWLSYWVRGLRWHPNEEFHSFPFTSLEIYIAFQLLGRTKGAKIIGYYHFCSFYSTKKLQSILTLHLPSEYDCYWHVKWST